MSLLTAMAKRFMPHSAQEAIRRAAWFNARQARRFASSSKRLDLCAAQVAALLHLCGRPSLRDRVCLEVGSGWVLTHALVMHLLGAQRVFATDVAAMARPSALRLAVVRSVPSIVRDLLAPLDDHAAVRRRVDRLRNMKHPTFEALREIGIEYVAPIDLAARPFGRPYDWVFSFSVLEHVPQKDVAPLLSNLAADLRDGGRMVHCVHLEDHQDFENHPFAFLGEPAGRFTPEVQGSRGNRIRRSGWDHLLSQLPGVRTRMLYEWARQDKPLPGVIDPSISHLGEQDLRVSHLGLLIEKGGPAAGPALPPGPAKST